MFLSSPRSKPVSLITGFRFLVCALIYCVIHPSDSDAAGKNQVKESIDIASLKALPNPDTQLIEVYQLLARNQLDQAHIKIDELLRVYPNFQLAHLIRGDLLTVRTRPVNRFGAAQQANAERLKDLQEEAQARLRAITERPPKESVPANLLQMSEEQKYALVMDAKRARLYLYENKAGVPTLVTDYYVSQGKFGIDKFKEGDQRTPLGVYYITQRLPGAKLPDFYGPGALPLNYPNEWDKKQGRGGSGIWLHGVPSTNFSRPPLASDGCVVLSNPDFLKLAATVDIAKTPVIIAEQVQFIPTSAWTQEKRQASKLIEDWRHDFSSKNAIQLQRHYSSQFKNSSNENLSTWINKQAALMGINQAQVQLRDFSQFRYPGKQDVIVSQFIQDGHSNRGPYSLKRQQYWVKEGQAWRIAFEDSNQISGNKIDFSARELSKIPNTDTIASAAKATKVLEPKESKSQTIVKNDGNQAEVAKALERWQQAWASKNTRAYLAAYARDFQTPNGESRKSWMEERRSRIEGKGKIKLNLEAPSIKIEGNVATIKFRQHYQSGALSAVSRKTLVMHKQEGKWLIKQERTGS